MPVPSELADQIEAAANTSGKALAVYGGFAQPDSPNTNAHVVLFAQAIQETLTALAMMGL